MSSHAINFNIAEMSTCLSIDLPLSERMEGFLSRYKEFVSSDKRAAFSIGIQIEAGDPFIEITPGPLEVQTHLTGHRVEFESHQEKGWFDLEGRIGQLILRPEGSPENYMRVLYAWRCLDEDGLLLHASGIIRRGNAFVFFGPSGSGKTTTVDLTPNGIILSDDLVIIKFKSLKNKNRLYAYSVPFRGETANLKRINISAPLKALYRLRQAMDHRVLNTSASKAVAEMAASVPFVMHHPSNALRVLKICQQIESNVPVQELHFRKDPDFWNSIDLALVDGSR
jgi:hypothetical protein